jgi:uncharacterized protein
MELPSVRRRADLGKLPWFERVGAREHRLRPEAGVPAIVDIHAHVGWSYGISKRIDMQARPAVRYFYDYDFDQDVLNDDSVHPTPEETALITRESMWALARVGASSVTHTVGNLAEEMELMGYRHCCLLPIEGPFSRAHSSQTLAAARLDRRLIPFAAVHPWPWTAGKEKRLAYLKDQGARALKFHPEFQFIAPDNPHALRLFAWCEANGLPVLAHVGYKGVEPGWMRRKAEPERFRAVLEAFPKLKLLLAHTGITRYEAVLALAREFPEQVWLDVAGQDVPIMRHIFRHYAHERILYGSDWPFYPLDVMVARALVATEGDEELRMRLLQGNAAAFYGGLCGL